jgi:hypothetical protein
VLGAELGRRASTLEQGGFGVIGGSKGARASRGQESELLRSGRAGGRADSERRVGFKTPVLSVPTGISQRQLQIGTTGGFTQRLGEAPHRPASAAVPFVGHFGGVYMEKLG